MKSFLFVLSGNLSTTPRALKTILSLPKGCSADILLVNRHPLWTAKDQEIIKKHDLNVTTLSLGRKPFLPWLGATFLEKTAQKIYPFSRKDISVNAYASNKSSILLWHYLKKLNTNPYDLILGFSSGSLYPVFKLSQKWKVPFSFDVEDFHPGEQIDFDVDNEIKRREFLLKKLLPKASLMTSASPLIEKYTLDLIKGHPNHRLVLNGFPQKEFIPPKPEEQSSPSAIKTLNLVWFSQKVSYGRGLEHFLKALAGVDLKKKNFRLSLTLIGDMDPVFQQQIINPAKEEIDQDFIKFTELPALSQEQLHLKLSEYDVGLALEPGKDLNNELALSNKIMAYSQAGLYILATNTKAQVDFMKKYPEMGIIFPSNTGGMKSGLTQLFKTINTINRKGVSFSSRQRTFVGIGRRIINNTF